MPYRPKTSRLWHYDFQIRGRRFCGSCGTTDFEEAKAVEAAARVRARTAPEVTGRFTLSEALGTYFTDVAQGQSSAATTLSQCRAILAVLDGARPMDSLTNADLMRFVATRRAQVSDATVNRHLQALGRALRHMARIHGATMPPIDIRSLQRAEPEERVRELTTADQERLFQHLRLDLHPMVKFALMTGARLSTIIGLRWSDIDDGNGRVTFRIKQSRTMRFPLSPEIRALLSALPRADAPDDRPFVFTYQDHSSKALTRRAIRQNSHIFDDFRAALTAAGIDDFRFHDLRHTFATRLLRRTGNIKLVSRLLGHTKVETTSRYAHVLDGDLAAALDGFSVLTNSEPRRNSRSRKNKQANS